MRRNKEKKKDKMVMARKKYKLIPSRDINDQKILQSNLTRCTLTGQSQPKAIVSGATFP